MVSSAAAAVSTEGIVAATGPLAKTNASRGGCQQAVADAGEARAQPLHSADIAQGRAQQRVEARATNAEQSSGASPRRKAGTRVDPLVVADPASPHHSQGPAPDRGDQAVVQQHDDGRARGMALRSAMVEAAALADWLPGGLRNLGATCYANAVMQCLAQLPSFVAGVADALTTHSCPAPAQCVLCATEAALTAVLAPARDGSDPPSLGAPIVNLIPGAAPTHRHEDAHEFWSLLLSSLAQFGVSAAVSGGPTVWSGWWAHRRGERNLGCLARKLREASLIAAGDSDSTGNGRAERAGAGLLVRVCL